MIFRTGHARPATTGTGASARTTSSRTRVATFAGRRGGLASLQGPTLILHRQNEGTEEVKDGSALVDVVCEALVGFAPRPLADRSAIAGFVTVVRHGGFTPEIPRLTPARSSMRASVSAYPSASASARATFRIAT
jgi:hypothetical protein